MTMMQRTWPTQFSNDIDRVNKINIQYKSLNNLLNKKLVKAQLSVLILTKTVKVKNYLYLLVSETKNYDDFIIISEAEK